MQKNKIHDLFAHDFFRNSWDEIRVSHKLLVSLFLITAILLPIFLITDATNTNGNNVVSSVSLSENSACFTLKKDPLLVQNYNAVQCLDFEKQANAKKT